MHWMLAGDVGTIVGRGALKIIDRKKNIFKLAQGRVCDAVSHVVYDKIQTVTTTVEREMTEIPAD